MDKHPSVLIVGFFLILILSGLISIACAQNGLTVNIELFEKARHVPIFIVCAVVIFVLNGLVFFQALIISKHNLAFSILNYCCMFSNMM